jgi:hypothetical protein
MAFPLIPVAIGAAALYFLSKKSTAAVSPVSGGGYSGTPSSGGGTSAPSGGGYTGPSTPSSDGGGSDDGIPYTLGSGGSETALGPGVGTDQSGGLPASIGSGDDASVSGPMWAYSPAHGGWVHVGYSLPLPRARVGGGGDGRF